MTPEQVRKIYECLDVSDAKELEEKIGLSIHFSSYNTSISFNNTDPFYLSYTSGKSKYVSFLDSGELADEYIKEIKQTVSRKIKQRNLLEHIRLIALDNIDKFLKESFDIDNYDPEDVTFEDYSRFNIGGESFSYSGTITRKEFMVEPYSYSTYGTMYKKINNIKKFYNDKKER